MSLWAYGKNFTIFWCLSCELKLSKIIFLFDFKFGSFSQNKTEYFIEPQEDEGYNGSFFKNSTKIPDNQTSTHLQAHLIFRKAFNLDENHSPHCSLLGKKNQINNNANK